MNDNCSFFCSNSKSPYLDDSAGDPARFDSLSSAVCEWLLLFPFSRSMLPKSSTTLSGADSYTKLLICSGGTSGGRRAGEVTLGMLRIHNRQQKCGKVTFSSGISFSRQLRTWAPPVFRPAWRSWGCLCSSLRNLWTCKIKKRGEFSVRHFVAVAAPYVTHNFCRGKKTPKHHDFV